MLQSQPSGDLHRRASQPQLLLHSIPQLVALRESRHLRALRGGPCGLIRRRCPVAITATVSVDLAAHGRRHPLQPTSYRPERFACRQPARDLLAFLKRQPASSPAPLRRTDPALLIDQLEDRVLRAAHRPCRVRGQLPALIAVPHLIVIDPLTHLNSRRLCGIIRSSTRCCTHPLNPHRKGRNGVAVSNLRRTPPRAGLAGFGARGCSDGDSAGVILQASAHLSGRIVGRMHGPSHASRIVQRRDRS
jgi:hypothetical protein